MSDVVRFVEIAGQHVELLPARTLLQTVGPDASTIVPENGEAPAPQSDETLAPQNGEGPLGGATASVAGAVDGLRGNSATDAVNGFFQ